MSDLPKPPVSKNDMAMHQNNMYLYLRNTLETGIAHPQVTEAQRDIALIDPKLVGRTIWNTTAHDLQVSYLDGNGNLAWKSCTGAP